jgi:uncharacterized small protein (TIGR04563 family)
LDSPEVLLGASGLSFSNLGRLSLTEGWRVSHKACLDLIKPWSFWMAGTDKRKQSLYFPEDMLEDIEQEAGRQDRSLSWVVQQAWKLARERIKSFPAVNDVGTTSTGTPNS